MSLWPNRGIFLLRDRWIGVSLSILLMITPAYRPPVLSRAAATPLLWTAGWDSTYRLIDLVIGRGEAVEPHYIVDPDRPGTMQELKAMRAIRARIAKDFPGRERLIAPTRTTLLDSIAEDPEITAKFARLKSRAYLGSQYDWLARYVRQQGIRELELCIHADDRAEAFVRDYVERVEEEDGQTYWRVRREVADDDVGLFAAFRFPVLRLTKTEMRRRAAEAGFGRIMALTWFCHTPMGGRPCGVCNPCRYTIAEGLADRLPGRALLRNRFASQMRLTRKVSGPFYKALAAMARPLVKRERRRCEAVVR